MRPLGSWPVFITVAIGALLATACSTIKPSTTAPAAAGPYVAGDDESVVVFHRRSLNGPDTRGDDLPFVERWSYVRVFDSDGAPLADLRATEHAVVHIKPGEHQFFVKNWAAEPHPICVAALKAALDRGRVYAIDIDSAQRDTQVGCEPLRLIPVERFAIEAFFDHLAKTRSEQKTFLADKRETSIFLDNKLVTDKVILVGTERLAKRPVALAPDDGIAWTAEHSGP